MSAAGRVVVDRDVSHNQRSEQVEGAEIIQCITRQLGRRAVSVVTVVTGEVVRHDVVAGGHEGSPDRRWPARSAISMNCQGENGIGCEVRIEVGQDQPSRFDDRQPWMWYSLDANRRDNPVVWPTGNLNNRVSRRRRRVKAKIGQSFPCRLNKARVDIDGRHMLVAQSAAPEGCGSAGNGPYL